MEATAQDPTDNLDSNQRRRSWLWKEAGLGIMILEDNPPAGSADNLMSADTSCPRGRALESAFPRYKTPVQ